MLLLVFHKSKFPKPPSATAGCTACQLPSLLRCTMILNVFVEAVMPVLPADRKSMSLGSNSCSGAYTGVKILGVRISWIHFKTATLIQYLTLACCMFCCFRPIPYKHFRLRSKLTSSSFQLIYQFCAGDRHPSKLCKELTGISHEAVTAWGTEDVSSPSLLRIEAKSSWISKLLQVSVHIPSAVLPYPAGTAFRTFWEPHLNRCSWESGSVIHTEFSANLRVEGSVLSVDSVVTSEVQFKEKPVIPSQSLPTPGPKPPRKEELAMHDLAQACAKRSIQNRRIAILAELGKKSAN